MPGSIEVYQELLEKLNKGEKAAVVTRFNSESPGVFTIAEKFVSTGACADNIFSEGVKLQEHIRSALDSGSLRCLREKGDGWRLIEPYFPAPRLIVLGGGHIAKPLVGFGAKVGFSVTVFDDRPSFANTARFPDAKKVICDRFENSTQLLEINKASFVVVVTRGHRHDMDCLKQVLKQDCAYVGMIGSRRRVKGIKEQLLKEGYPREKVEGVCAPIGLDIGAVTPEEIAVAIIAQVIHYRRNKYAPGGVKAGWPEYDEDVLASLGKGPAEPKAVVTIVDTKGPVPREAGAKMVVWPDGRILGSIGGGCGEGEAIAVARDVVNLGLARRITIDMTGEVAEEEGMVCGGVMDVVVEPC